MFTIIVNIQLLWYYVSEDCDFTLIERPHKNKKLKRMGFLFFYLIIYQYHFSSRYIIYIKYVC